MIFIMPSYCRRAPTTTGAADRARSRHEGKATVPRGRTHRASRDARKPTAMHAPESEPSLARTSALARGSRDPAPLLWAPTTTGGRPARALVTKAKRRSLTAGRTALPATRASPPRCTPPSRSRARPARRS